MYVAILAAYPYAAHQLWREAYEPTIRVVIGGTGFAAHFTRDVVLIAQSVTRTVVYHGPEHVYHLI